MVNTANHTICWVRVEVKGWKLKEPLELCGIWCEKVIWRVCIVVTWMPDCLEFIVKSGSSPQGRILENKVRTSIFLSIHKDKYASTLDPCSRFIDNDILILGCIKKDQTDPIGYGFQMFFFSIIT